MCGKEGTDESQSTDTPLPRPERSIFDDTLFVLNKEDLFLMCILISSSQQRLSTTSHHGFTNWKKILNV